MLLIMTMLNLTSMVKAKAARLFARPVIPSILNLMNIVVALVEDALKLAKEELSAKVTPVPMAADSILLRKNIIVKIQVEFTTPRMLQNRSMEEGQEVNASLET